MLISLDLGVKYHCVDFAISLISEWPTVYASIIVMRSYLETSRIECIWKYLHLICRTTFLLPGLGWNYPCDLWSVGCILVELCSVS